MYNFGTYKPINKSSNKNYAMGTVLFPNYITQIKGVLTNPFIYVR